MPVVTFPADTAKRLTNRIERYGETRHIKLFPASDVVMGLVFTTAELEEFDGEAGDAMILAVDNLASLAAAIPEFEDGRRNYCIIRNERAIARLDPFA